MTTRGRPTAPRTGSTPVPRSRSCAPVRRRRAGSRPGTAPPAPATTSGSASRHHPRALMPAADLYISFDIEADGPVPGPYSMLSIGLAVAGTFDGERFERRDPAAQTIYRELRPISEAFDPEALAVSGLDRDALMRDGRGPAEALREIAGWVDEVAAGFRAVAVAYPLAYDWMWLHWYLRRFTDRTPFGFSRALDMKTMYARQADVVIDDATKDRMPPELLSARRHTHNALDDAIEQAELFQNLFTWGESARR